MPGDGGRARLPKPADFATREQFTNLPHWTFGHLVMYDYRAALRRVRPYNITEHARILHRTTVAENGPTA